MDEGRKYRQRGYQQEGNGGGERQQSDRPRPKGPKPPIDVTGPRLPRLVTSVTASRCYNCAVTLASGTDFTSECPKCGVPLHCCKQCTFFEPSTRFQCVKPIPERIPLKDKENDCEWFSPTVTVARDSGHSQSAPAANSLDLLASPKNSRDARTAFDNLFKK